MYCSCFSPCMIGKPVKVLRASFLVNKWKNIKTGYSPQSIQTLAMSVCPLCPRQASSSPQGPVTSDIGILVYVTYNLMQCPWRLFCQLHSMRYFHMHHFPRQGSPIKTGNWVCLMSQKTISSAEENFFFKVISS